MAGNTLEGQREHHPQEQTERPVEQAREEISQTMAEQFLELSGETLSQISSQFLDSEQHQNDLDIPFNFIMGELERDRPPEVIAASGLLKTAANAIADALTESPEERAQRIAEEQRQEEQERSEAEEKLAEAKALLASSAPAIADSIGEVAASIQAELGDGRSSSSDSLLREALNRLKQIQSELEKAG